MKPKNRVYHIQGVNLSPQPTKDSEPKACPYRGDQTRTIIHATCKNRTINVEVYSCGLFGGECVHRKYCTDHDPALRVCVGCPRE